MTISTQRAAITAAAMLSATSAMAQVAVSQGVPVPRRGTVVERSIGADVGVTATYDGNVAGLAPQNAAASGIRPEDFIISPGIDLDIQLPLGRSALSLSGGVGYNFNLRNPRRDGERINLAGSLSADLRRCNLSLDSSINRQRSEFGNFDPTLINSVVLDNMETTVEFGGSIGCGGAVGFRPFASVNYARGRNSLAIRKVSDYQTVSYGGGITYFQPSLGEIGIVGSIDRSDYPERPEGSLILGQPSFTARSIGVYFNRELARTLQARIRVNYTDIAPGIDSAAFSGLSGEVAVKFVPGGRFEIEARGARAASPSLSFTADYVLETGGALTVRVPVGPRVQLRGGFDYRDRKYYGGPPVLVNRLENDSIATVSGSANLQVNRRVTLGLGAAYEWRRANGDFYDYNAGQVFLSARMGL